MHLAYLVYAAVGGFLGLRGLAWLLPHVISTVWSITVTLTPVNCPLTALERWLLEMGGRTPYDESFTAHYLRDVVYPVQYETAIWLGMMALAGCNRPALSPKNTLPSLTVGPSELYAYRAAGGSVKCRNAPPACARTYASKRRTSSSAAANSCA